MDSKVSRNQSGGSYKREGVVGRLSSFPFEEASGIETTMVGKKPNFIAPKFEREYDYQSTAIEEEWEELTKAKAELKKREAEIAKLTETLSLSSATMSSKNSVYSENSDHSGRSRRSSKTTQHSAPVIVQAVRKVDTGGGMWGFEAPNTLPVLMPNGEIVYPRKPRPKMPRSERLRREKEAAEKEEREKVLEEQFKKSTKARELNDAKALETLEKSILTERNRSQSVSGMPFKQQHQAALHKSKSSPPDQISTESDIAEYQLARQKAFPIPEPSFDDGISLAEDHKCSPFAVSNLKKLFKK